MTQSQQVMETTENAARMYVVCCILPIYTFQRMGDERDPKRVELVRQRFINGVREVITALEEGMLEETYGIGTQQLERLVRLADEKPWDTPEVTQGIIEEYAGMRSPPRRDDLENYTTELPIVSID